MTTTNLPKLIIQFGGWILMRIPTDPDPTDEPRGVSGYTFAFGNEINLNREISFQKLPNFSRSHTFDIGVKVLNAVRTTGDPNDPVVPIGALQGATVDLLKDSSGTGSRLENRNWTLTPAGFEPIVPFNFQIKGQDITLLRSAPLVDPEHPVDQQNKQVWELPESLLQTYGAVGVLYEPATIGNATGIWDSVQVAAERLKLLKNDQQELEKKGKVKKLTPDEDVAKVIIAARIKELGYAVANPQDRRIMARYYVERFNFPMYGVATVLGDQQKTLYGKILSDLKNPWSIGFWIGAWDPDALSAYVLGALEITYAS